ncbi:MAG: hypothetical protein LBE56_10285 [Tannerella sp.]|jgi:hypothetical protein|nr:hypothetical protein [Tannerella sp.]
MKKKIAILCLLSANIFLLAHVVIPHHHHENGHICVVNTYKFDGKETHRHDQQDTQNQHDDNAGAPSDNCCVVDHIYPPENRLDLKITSPHYPVIDHGNAFYILKINLLNTQDLVGQSLTYYRLKDCIALYYTDFISQTLGLRAPPVA